MILILQDEYVQVYLCGASLIAPQVVLTSGHCVNDTENLQDILTVRCGEWDTQTEDEKYPFQELKVNRIQVCAGRGMLGNSVICFLFLERRNSLFEKIPRL